MNDQNQRQEKKKLNIVFSVDDVHPEIGYGALKNNDQFKYLKQLHDEFGIKFTLFLVPFWRGNTQFDISKKKDWIKWIENQGFYEIAMHGLTHTANKPEYGAMEFIGITDEEIEKRLLTSLELFENSGIDIKGCKTPGWEHPPSMYKIAKKIGLTWIADHFIGEDPIKMSNGLYRIPYNCNTEHLQFAFPRKTAILHSHISPEEGNKNGWTSELYEKTRQYLLNLQKEYEFNCVTMSELVENA